MLDELDVLIEEFGGDALAIEFSRNTASEPLSRVIEAVMNDENRENPPTLETIREAVVSGLPARLIGMASWRTMKTTHCFRRLKR